MIVDKIGCDCSGNNTRTVVEQIVDHWSVRLRCRQLAVQLGGRRELGSCTANCLHLSLTNQWSTICSITVLVFFPKHSQPILSTIIKALVYQIMNR